MGQVEKTKDRCLFRLTEKATIYSSFALGQRSRMLRAIDVPPNASGGCRFSRHWQHPVFVSSETQEARSVLIGCEKCNERDRSASGIKMEVALEQDLSRQEASKDDALTGGPEAFLYRHDRPANGEHRRSPTHMSNEKHHTR